MRANLIFHACCAILTGTVHPASSVATAWAVDNFSNSTWWFCNAGLLVLSTRIFVIHDGICTIFIIVDGPSVFFLFSDFNVLTKRIQQKIKIASKIHSKRKHWNIWVNIFTTELLHLHILLLNLSSLLFFEFFCGSSIFISPTNPWLLNQLLCHC